MQLVAGRISRPHGLRGEVVVDVRTDDPDGRFVVGAELATEPAAAGPLRIESVRSHQGKFLIRFAGCANRESVEPLVGLQLMVDATRSDDPDAFYDHELVGLAAVNLAGESVGTVQRVWHNPGQELLEVLRPDGHPALVPFVAAIVTHVDVAGGRVVIDAPPGLLEDVPGEPPAEG